MWSVSHRLLPRASGWEDDLAFENGIGFTDIVKRPTAKASEVRREEFARGRDLLRAKIERVCKPRLVSPYVQEDGGVALWTDRREWTRLTTLYPDRRNGIAARRASLGREGLW